MDFTREPIIETVITPKEGCKIVVRSSKSAGQEEYFVDAVEVVSFGSLLFFRSLERPKAFLVPATDYEVLEVREARMVLKNVGLDRSIKIGGGREAAAKQPKELPQEKPDLAFVGEEISTEQAEGATPETKPEGRLEKKRDRRRHYRRRRGREETKEEGLSEETTGEALEKGKSDEGKIEIPAPQKIEASEEEPHEHEPITHTPSFISSLLPPPTTLISETIGRYKDNALFKGAFFRDDEKAKEEPKEDSESLTIALEQPAYGSLNLSEEEEDEIYQERARRFFSEEEPELGISEEDLESKKEIYSEEESENKEDSEENNSEEDSQEDSISKNHQ